MRGSRNPPAPTKNSSVVMTLEFLFYLNFYKAPQGWIRTAAALSRKTAQKQPSGLFLAARLAQSTRAHKKTADVERYAGGFLFAEDGAAALGGGQDALSLVWRGFITSLS